MKQGHDPAKVWSDYPVSLAYQYYRAGQLNRRLELVAHSEAVFFGVLAAIDRAFGGKGKALDLYRKEILGDDAKEKPVRGMTRAARQFFGIGIEGLVPVVKVPRES